jgi:hypothetical protein
MLFSLFTARSTVFGSTSSPKGEDKMSGFHPPFSRSNISNLFADGELDRHEREMRAALATLR